MVQSHTQGLSMLGTTQTWARFRMEFNRTRTSRVSKGSRNTRTSTTTFPPGFNPHHLRRSRPGLERVLIPQMPCPLSVTSPAQWRPDWLSRETESDVGESVMLKWRGDEGSVQLDLTCSCVNFWFVIVFAVETFSKTNAGSKYWLLFYY